MVLNNNENDDMIHPTENNAIAETEANNSHNFYFLQVDVFSKN